MKTAFSILMVLRAVDRNWLMISKRLPEWNCKSTQNSLKMSAMYEIVVHRCSICFQFHQMLCLFLVYILYFPIYEYHIKCVIFCDRQIKEILHHLNCASRELFFTREFIEQMIYFWNPNKKFSLIFSVTKEIIFKKYSLVLSNKSRNRHLHPQIDTLIKVIISL